MQELNNQEVEKVSGGLPLIVLKLRDAIVVSIIGYTAYKIYQNEDITIQGLALAAGVGMLMGGIL
jgi:hypothetical protein